MVGEVRMIANDETIPTIIDVAIPFEDVLSQKSKNKIAGKLAEAAIAKAHPTKKETFIPLKAIPKPIAKTPTPKAASLPALTFFSSLRFFLRYTSIKS